MLLLFLLVSAFQSFCFWLFAPITFFATKLFDFRFIWILIPLIVIWLVAGRDIKDAII
tara:strand:+ start:330 stop:503 length:174 start_codon:yes stop_codon:yes gene_type:complete